MIMIDDTTALVFDTNDLRDAVSSDNGVDLVYFGANIVLAYGITIYPNKPSLTFDGTYEGVRYTFTDMGNTGSGNTIGIRAVSNITITFQNIDLIGRNFFGIPYVPNDMAYYGVSTKYKDVTYSGIQLTHNPYGFTSYTDCTITVNNNEVAETNRLEIGGTTTIEKTNQENALFWFYGSSTQRPYLKILSGADVTITTAHYFMYEHHPPDYIIEDNANFTLNTNSGISYTSAHTVASFLVGENASFRFTQNTNRGYPSLYLDGALTVNGGADFYMQADFENNNPLIQFTGSAGSLNLNTPKSFALYNRGNASARAFFFYAQIPFLFAGNQVNRWDSPKEFPIAGTFDDEPQFKWNKPNYELFRMEGRVDNSRTYVDSHNFTEEELNQMSPLDELKLRDAVVFSEGYLPLSVNPVIIGTRPISGKTTKKAKVRISRAGSGHYPDCDADDDGRFSLTPTDPFPFAEVFTITSNTPFLLTTMAVESREEGLYISEAPEFIQFYTHPITDFSNVVLPRQIPGARVVVTDTREVKTRWVIWVKTTGPLQTAENDILDEAVVFAVQDGSLLTIGSSLTAVHTDGPYPEDEPDVPIIWDNNRGVLARITTPIRSGRKYTTQLGWVVYPEGVQPLEE